jgi:hypothetical protein
VLTHINFVSVIASTAAQGCILPRPTDVVVAYLPLAHILELLVEVCKNRPIKEQKRPTLAHILELLVEVCLESCIKDLGFRVWSLGFWLVEVCLASRGTCSLLCRCVSKVLLMC